MSYKHSELAEKLLQQAGIPFKVPTAGHYVIYKKPDTFDETKLIWFPKNNKVQTEDVFGKVTISNKGTRQDTIAYIQTWLKEGTNDV